MGNAFEDAMHQGYSAEEMAADAEAFEREHGCLDCELNGQPGCWGATCDMTYKGGRA